MAGTSGKVTLGITAMQATITFKPDGGAPVTLGPFDIRGLCTAADGGFVGLTYGALALGSAAAATFAGAGE